MRKNKNKNKKSAENSKISKAKTAAIVAAIGVLMTASGLTGYKLVKEDGSCDCGLGDFWVVERVVSECGLLELMLPMKGSVILMKV